MYRIETPIVITISPYGELCSVLLYNFLLVLLPSIWSGA